MKPSEGRKRIIIEEIQPSVNDGRYPAKRILGDQVEVTAAIFGDGHDHVAARLLYRHASQRKWSSVPFTEINNDRWTATSPPAPPTTPPNSASGTSPSKPGSTTSTPGSTTSTNASPPKPNPRKTSH